ncbi:MAG: hypothetical protein ACYDD2_11590 [Candidatus Acidiferrales bacterium]
MTRSEAIDALEKFRMNPWEFQLTFETPLKSLQPFVKTILDALKLLKLASVTIDLVVFEPRDLIGMLASRSIPPTYERGVCLTATDRLEIEELLRVTLSEWIDFLFVPEPSQFVIYADHDEFTTFYAHTRLTLDRVAGALLDQGFKMEANYERRF